MFNCKKEDSILIPTVSVSSVTDVTGTSASTGGEVIFDGGAEVTSRGICWGTTQNPTNVDSHLSCGSGMGSFSGSVSGLNPGTIYYLRTYAINAIGTAYSGHATFSTLASIPVLTTTEVSNITYTSGTCGGSITNDGTSPVLERGICWQTSQNPTIANSKIANGTGSGTFTGSLPGLIGGTTYYVRAYALNSIGIGYGNQVTFKTNIGLPVISTFEPFNITGSSASSGGNITNDCGSQVTARGVCYSPLSNPTISDYKTVDGTGTGVFYSNMTGLVYGYWFVRAYATNSAGTAYGNEYYFFPMDIIIITGKTNQTKITGQ